MSSLERLTFSADPKVDTAILLPQNAVYANNKQAIGSAYFAPIGKYLDEKIGHRVVALGAYTPKKGKIKKAELVEFGEEVLNYCQINGVETLIVANGDYFKYFSGCKAVEKHIGESFECVIETYGDIMITPSINLTAVSMFPEKQILLDKANKKAAQLMSGEWDEDEEFEFKSYEVAKTREDLFNLLDKDVLAIDIETTGLRFEVNKMVSIAFAWSSTEALSIPIHESYHGKGQEDYWLDNLKEFFEAYTGKKLFHNYLFDAKFLVRHLFMDSPIDYEGRSYGAKVMDSDDTMIMAYLCLNSTTRNSLSLKDLSYEHVGEYAVNVKDCLAIPKDELLEYNAMDVVATYWVYEKYSKLLVSEGQQGTYDTIMQPSLNYLLQMMLNGLSVDKGKVAEAKKAIGKILHDAEASLRNNAIVKLVVRQLRLDASEKYNATRIKQKTPGDFMDLAFNPNSPKQLRILLFDVMGYEPLDTTPTGQPKTNRDAIVEFLESEELVEKREVLEALVAISQTAIIINTFLEAFDTLSVDIGEPLHKLYGNQRLGGTLSGRLSSNSPNFANMPSGSEYGKQIKACFQAPEGWLFASSDYAALEDRVGSDITGDINKRNEFLMGFDGHSLRAYAFFKEEIDEALGEELDVTDPKSINRIKKELEKIRGKSKSPSFAMAYGSGAGKIQDLLKCSKEEADRVYAAYHALYKGTKMYADKSIQEAEHQGYTTGAFGLKLRTPRIKSKDRKTSSGEGRTLNNMRIQSYGLLMNRAGINLQKRIEEDSMMDSIVPVNQIHDALYYIIKDDPNVVKWLNDNLIPCMIEDYREEQVIHLEAELDIGPSWDKQYTLPNDISTNNIKRITGVINDPEAIKQILKEI